MFTLQADVLVNSIDKSFDLKKGKISQSILNKAGLNLQTEVNTVSAKKKSWDIFETNSHNIASAKFILHGSLEKNEVKVRVVC